MNITEEVNNWCNTCALFKSESCNECITAFGGRPDMWVENKTIATADTPTIKDSGERTEFKTGAVRDMHEGKGRFDLLPWTAIWEVAKHCENGAKKYGEHNVDKGIEIHSFIDSAFRHLMKYTEDWTDEPHLTAAAWNISWAIQTEIKHPELKDIPFKEYTEHKNN